MAFGLFLGGIGLLGSLISYGYLIIFMIFMYSIADRFSYMQYVGIYTVGRGLLPALIPFTGVVTIIASTVFHFLIGLIFVKLFYSLTEYIERYMLVVAIGSILEFIISIVFSLLIMHFVFL